MISKAGTVDDTKHTWLLWHAPTSNYHWSRQFSVSSHPPLFREREGRSEHPCGTHCWHHAMRRIDCGCTVHLAAEDGLLAPPARLPRRLARERSEHGSRQSPSCLLSRSWPRILGIRNEL